ncbi:glycosyl transferase [Intrasporangium oryzae NRRL B-24470]|uniref:D-inositol 3-phosphate glycosyltransferase n=1 Tax=Intrasporangium oryzae NRRL B-24470 TaxID=1386089 RepID=W9GC96_9MICO|nr:glycosyltransferase [Intrasporangium oryzae]EWT02852.1 glycosyl transferase [Intrasporangium oryzae NRRL B-24470]
MKVALLSDCYLPRLGGIEVQTHDLARHLSMAGHTVEVFTATPGPEGEMRGEVTVHDGIPVHRLAAPMPWDLPVNPRAPRTLRQRLVAGAFDVAHVQTGVVSPFAWDATRVALGIGLPTAMTWHCMLAGAAPVFSAARFVRRWAGRGVAMSAVSTMAAEPLRRIIGTDATVEVLPNGIDVSRWAVGPEERRPGPLRLVTAMRLAARKRPGALVELVRRAESIAGLGALSLTILGEGPERRRVEAHVEKHRLGWVDLPGRVSRDELRERYAASDVYLSPTRLEAFGIAALEARTVGLPVIGRSGSGVSEFVSHGVNGLVVDDDDAMARAIAGLAASPGDVARMRAWNVANPPQQGWPQVVDRAVAEYTRARSLVGR